MQILSLTWGRAPMRLLDQIKDEGKVSDQNKVLLDSISLLENFRSTESLEVTLNFVCIFVQQGGLHCLPAAVY